MDDSFIPDDNNTAGNNDDFDSNGQQYPPSGDNNNSNDGAGGDNTTLLGGTTATNAAAAAVAAGPRSAIGQDDNEDSPRSVVLQMIQREQAIPLATLHRRTQREGPAAAAARQRAAGSLEALRGSSTEDRRRWEELFDIESRLPPPLPPFLHIPAPFPPQQLPAEEDRPPGVEQEQGEQDHHQHDHDPMHVALRGILTNALHVSSSGITSTRSDDPFLMQQQRQDPAPVEGGDDEVWRRNVALVLPLPPQPNDGSNTVPEEEQTELGAYQILAQARLEDLRRAMYPPHNNGMQDREEMAARQREEETTGANNDPMEDTATPNSNVLMESEHWSPSSNAATSSSNRNNNGDMASDMKNHWHH